MILCIADILDATALARARELVSGQSFVAGTETAGWAARLVKNNEQLDSGTPVHAELQSLLSEAILGNDLFVLAASPARLRPLLISRYGAGMGYGAHVDNAMMGSEPRIRTDISFTLFLSDPEDYEGGELVIDNPAAEFSYKLPAGTLLLYPSTTLHRVETVTSGERLVAVGWAQSLIRDPAQREILFELETARRNLFAESGKSPLFDTLSKSTSNLWRMWAEP